MDVRGKKDLAADFNEELWLPVMTPSMTGTIEIIVMDKDRASSDDRVGTIFLDFRDVRVQPSPAQRLRPPPTHTHRTPAATPACLVSQATLLCACSSAMEAWLPSGTTSTARRATPAAR